MSKAADRLENMAEELSRDIHGAYDDDAAILRAAAELVRLCVNSPCRHSNDVGRDECPVCLVLAELERIAESNT